MMDDSFDPTFLTADVDVDFDFLRQQTRHPDENYWISEEQVEEITADSPGEFPTAADWKDDAPEVICNTEVSIDKARRHLWKQAKTGIGILRTVWEVYHPSFNTLATRIFGSKSKLFQLLEEELLLTYEKYCRFLASFFAASCRSSPATRLLEDRRFNSTGMMKKGEYYKLLKQIEEHRSGDKSLWMQIEELFNSLAKTHFLSERDEEELYVALDDDKHHFNYSKHADTYGLKRCQHIKDNRFGHTAHTAGLSATGYPLCVIFEREDEAQSQVYERMCKKMFGGRTGNGYPNLQGTFVFVFVSVSVSVFLFVFVFVFVFVFILIFIFIFIFI
jgi:antitoxin component HigA of HigAB toxin-antitoxin module